MAKHFNPVVFGLTPAEKVAATLDWTADVSNKPTIGTSTLGAQDVRDALKLAPSAGDPAAGSVDAHLDAILEDTGTTLPAQIAALDAGAGTGNNTIQFEITNADGDLLENAKVCLRQNGILKATGDTGVNGRLAGNGLAVEETGTYQLAVTCGAYNGHAADLVVTAGVNTMCEVELSIATYPDSTIEGTVTIRGRCYGVDRQPVGAGETVKCRIKVAAPDDGIMDKGYQTQTTDASGYVYFANVSPGQTLLFLCGDNSEPQEITIPDDATSPHDIGGLLGVFD